MHRVKIIRIKDITHDTKTFATQKPKGYNFTPGQATDVAINQPQWKDAKRPFTFTSLNQDKTLEFTIKSYDPKNYPDHDGMTFHLHTLKEGDELLIGNPWGTIEYKDRGVFIAAGAGITPFIAIFKFLAKEGKIDGNKLIYSNKTSRDVIVENKLTKWFRKEDLTLTLTREKKKGYKYGRVNAQMIKNSIDNFNQNFYVCGPYPFVKETKSLLESLGASPEAIVFEK